MKPHGTKFTISNVAGGDARTFRWNGQLSDRAIRHARSIGFGGPLFSGDARAEAAEAYERICAYAHEVTS